MGITRKDIDILLFSKKHGVSFEKVLTLGRLQLFANKNDIENSIKKFGIGDLTIENLN